MNVAKGGLVRRISAGLAVAAVAATALGACTPQTLLGQNSSTTGSTSAAMYSAPTADLTAVANALQFKQKSVTTQVSAPAGLTLSKPVAIQVTNDDTHTTASYYSKSAGYSEVYNFAPNLGLYDGSVHVLLTEQVSATQQKSFTVDYSPLINALYNVQISNLNFKLLNSCDGHSVNTTYLQWRDPKQGSYHVGYAQTVGQTVWTSLFSRNLTEVPQNTNLHFPTVSWWESHGQATPTPPFTPLNLVSVGSHISVDSVMRESTGQNCYAEATYTVNHQLLTYPSL